MDIKCPKCAEPIDNDEFHDIDGMTYDEAFKSFINKGCGSIGFSCNPDSDNDLRGQVMAAMADMMGDDSDGIISMMDDFDFMGDFD